MKIILAWVYIVTCGALLAIGSVVLVGLAWRADSSQIKELEFIGPPIGFVVVVYLICGIGLLRLRQWALILAFVMSAIQLPLLPCGTALGMYGFWIGLNPETRGIFGASAAAGGGPLFSLLRRGTRSPVWDLLGVMAMVASAFFLMLKFGFLLHHDPIPAPIDSFGLIVKAVLVLVFGFATVIARILGNCGKARTSGGDPADAEARQRARADARRQAEANFERYDRERYLRVAELAADPLRGSLRGSAGRQ